MASETFLLAIKSTIDKLGNDLALSLTPPALFVDLDDATATEAALASETNTIVWSLGEFQEDPRDPIYRLSFDIGPRTCNDPSNYTILALTGKVKALFVPGSAIAIKDYSGALATATQGTLFITDVSVNQQVYDKTSGVRLVSIYARAQRWL